MLAFSFSLRHAGKFNRNGVPMFSSRGIDAVVDYFKRRGHRDVIAWVPHYRFRTGQALEQELLHKLKLSGNLLQSPSREIPGFGPNINSYGELLFFQIYGCQFATCQLHPENTSLGRFIPS